ncbi:flagellin [Planomicrobium sp. CPCC 101110]|uniref:flagellin N-terminal helical domain-containing protein n=1 Tax=Planomicrobium sp. CPCC 101110 TaxID=2599619 RepID=UPI0011B60FCF|nr:flagellin [Planomicrobium sp. CPCC 101110]TWT27803.1 flagellin [Planomicrobium sp. CPCC 101110]
MIINHNIAALNTHRQMGNAQSAQMNSMEKLSSGLRINSAKDDAAGLAISEKMRGQIRGLEQATTNAQDGISLMQTAEGALNETHDILQRMRELAVQSSNDTNTDTDRKELQKEVTQLAEEITRIAENTEFNTKNLLGGEFSGKFHIGANADQNIELKISDMSSDALKVGTQYTVGEAGAITGLEFKGKVEAATYTAATTGTDPNVENVLQDSNGVTVGTWQAADTDEGTEAGYFNADGDLVYAAEVAETNGETVKIEASEAGYYDGTELKIAADAVLTEGTKVTVGIDISSQQDADSAITTINTAIESVSAERSKLGAVQNRLDHTINNLGTSAENLTAAESRIRDVDYAEAA